MGIGEYAAELFNAWLGWAGAMFTAFEVVRFLWKKEWGWPAAHPWRVAAAFLIIAQFGAYRSMAARATESAAASREAYANTLKEVEALKLEIAKLQGESAEKSRQIVTAQETNDQLRDRLADARNARPVEFKPKLEVKVPPGVGGGQAALQPLTEGITFTVKQVASTREDAPFAMEVTVQSRETVRPFAIGFVCDKPVKGSVRVVNASMYQMSDTTLSRGNTPVENSYAAESETGISPTTPWVVTLTGKEAFRILQRVRPAR